MSRTEMNHKSESIYPKISIITPTLNQGSFIEQTIKSVLSQDYPNIEYIIIDGGSTDGTIDVIKRYSDRIAYWVSEPDKGIADAFNKGVKASRGDYIQFLNSDDWLIEDSIISKVADAIKQNNCPHLLYGAVNMVDRETGEPLWSLGKKFNLKSFLLRMTIPHQALFTKRDYFDRYGFFDPFLRYSMDYEILLRSVSELQPVWIDQKIVSMREGGASRQNKAKTMLEAAKVQVRHGVHYPMYAYALSLLFIGGMSLRDVLENLGLRISWRF